MRVLNRELTKEQRQNNEAKEVFPTNSAGTEHPLWKKIQTQTSRLLEQYSWWSTDAHVKRKTITLPEGTAEENLVEFGDDFLDTTLKVYSVEGVTDKQDVVNIFKTWLCRRH